MISSTSSSARALALAALALLVSCGHAQRDLSRPLRLLVLPPHDLSAAGAPLAEIRARAELAIARVGAEIVTGGIVDDFLATRRTRHTGGIDVTIAADARDVLAADAVLVTTVGEWREQAPPAIQVTMRMVSTDDDPRLLWIQGESASGADGVGLLGLGGTGKVDELLGPVLRRLRDGLRASVNGPGRRATTCPADARFEPQTAFRFPGLDLRRPRKVAVLPFESRTGRRAAGEVIALEMTRGLASIPMVKLVEPGVIRATLLSGRFVMVEGLSLELGDVLMSNAEVDLVVSGIVEEYDEARPAIAFTVIVYDTRLRRVVWRSSSHHKGDDGVLLFEAGTVNGAGALACRMVAPVVRAIARPPSSGRTLSSLDDHARVALP